MVDKMRTILCVQHKPDVADAGCSADGINAARIEYLTAEAARLSSLFDAVAIIVPSHLDEPRMAEDPQLRLLGHALCGKVDLIWGRRLLPTSGGWDDDIYLSREHYRTALRVVREEAGRLGAESLIDIRALGDWSPHNDCDWLYGVRHIVTATPHSLTELVAEIMRSLTGREIADWVMGVGSSSKHHASWTLRRLGRRDMTCGTYGAHTDNMPGVDAAVDEINPPMYTPMPLTCWGSAVARDGNVAPDKYRLLGCSTISTTEWLRMDWRKLQEYMQIMGFGPLVASFVEISEPDITTDGYPATIGEFQSIVADLLDNAQPVCRCGHD